MECPLCYSKAKFFLEKGKREYWLCSTCSLISIPAKYFLSGKDEVKRYLEHENSMENTGYVDMFRQKIDVVKKVCPEARTVLDYGCGYEPVLKKLLDQEGYNAEGYDPNFFPDIQLKDQYDIIMSTETFEHLKQPGKELAALVPRLSPEGYLAVMTRFYPGKASLPGREDFENWYYNRDPTHIAFYCSDTFSWIAESFGLQVVFNNEEDFIILKKT